MGDLEFFPSESFQQKELPFIGSFDWYIIPESAELKHPGLKSSSLASGIPSNFTKFLSYSLSHGSLRLKLFID